MGSMENSGIKYFFERPKDLSDDILRQIELLVREGGAVGTTLIGKNLCNAYLIGYAMDGKRIVGSVILKNPDTEYVKKIESATGLDLDGYLERGYTSVEPSYRGRAIAHALIEGLVRRAPGQKIYVTIRMDNVPALKLTHDQKMQLAAIFTYGRTGHKIGVFTNQKPSSPRKDGIDMKTRKGPADGVG
jgi:GNAT superfamily N-acetyltransferase